VAYLFLVGRQHAGVHEFPIDQHDSRSNLVSTAVIGLLGALIGATAGLGAAWLTNSLQSRMDQAKWLLEARVAAYSKAIRHLYRAGYRMTKVSAESGPIIAEGDIKEWFDDVTEALYQVVWLTVVCGKGQFSRVQQAQSDLDAAVAQLLGDKRPSHPKTLRYQLAKTYQTIHVAARGDVGGAIPELSREALLEDLKRQADEEARVGVGT